jgi:peptidoglycan/LPS O-acetylase OafA/YrhL
MTIYGLACGAGPWGRALSLPPVVELGRASYSFYVLQLPVALAVLLARGAPPSMGQMNGGTFVAYLAVLVATALFARRFLEDPLRRRIRALAVHPDESSAVSGAEAPTPRA